jgi:hypothetical protein
MPANMSGMALQLVTETELSHQQMECDEMHSCIDLRPFSMPTNAIHQRRQVFLSDPVPFLSVHNPIMGPGGPRGRRDATAKSSSTSCSLVLLSSSILTIPLPSSSSSKDDVDPALHATTPLHSRICRSGLDIQCVFSYNRSPNQHLPCSSAL